MSANDPELMLRLLAIGPDGQPAGETWVPLPDDVTAANVESAVTRVFGDPIEAALDHHDTLGVLQVGWYFGNDRLAAFGLPADGNDALVFPCLVDEAGTSTPLYVASALEKQRLADLVGEDHLRAVDGRSEYRPAPSDERTDPQ